MKGRKPANIVAGKMTSVPAPPAWLSRLGKAEFRKIVTILIERNHLTNADLGTVAAYADALSQLADSTRQVNRDGMVVATPNGLRKHPAISIQINARNQVRQLAAELGLTPVSRSRPSIRDDNEDDTSFMD
ncbi:phage terminase, small subunit, putative, P27 [Nitrobacter hamburgensis X14]|uniref:Phage terminase, small subunit, putative, P27 n=1 Tax=Nitrobacter hamburgensis (strain DSM 10229 / NCIMB 13809 / X14) TaxID=323097 RepID=Q1QKH6_NITHX|nr:phage terminase small subunit P27 family [Nitrobacter hamburgensis]ABE63271.1 phage terminase, small subunit, putative, P27 [Nitrobacter hamburgensis X14]